MTNEQINAAIAEACGWVDCRVIDLNAMHEAEKVLTPVQIEDYVIEVMQFSHEPMLSTARQRAEAFLRTLGKWEEAK